MSDSGEMRSLQGLATARGFAVGPVFICRGDGSVPVPEYVLEPGCEEEEVLRYRRAVGDARRDLEGIVASLKERTGRDDVMVFECHLMMLEDAELSGAVERRIREEHVNAESAVKRVYAESRAKFERMNDPYFRERVRDLDDLERRLLAALTGFSAPVHRGLKVPSIIVADDLTPSETVQLPRDLVLGFATNGGSTTSHVALLARAMGIPAVTGLIGDLSPAGTIHPRKCVFNDRPILRLAENQPDGRPIPLVLNLSINASHVEPELSEVGRLEASRLELNDEITPQRQMIENQIREKLLVANLHTHLMPHIRKPTAQLGQRPRNVPHQRTFDLPLIVLIDGFGQTEKVGTLDKLRDSLALLGRENLREIVDRLTLPRVQISFQLILQLASAPPHRNRPTDVEMRLFRVALALVDDAPMLAPRNRNQFFHKLWKIFGNLNCRTPVIGF